MRLFVVRRLLAVIPLLLAVTLVGFALIQLVPGGPLAVYGDNPNISALRFGPDPGDSRA